MSPIYGADISGSLYDDVSTEAPRRPGGCGGGGGRAGSTLHHRGRDDTESSTGPSVWALVAGTCQLRMKGRSQRFAESSLPGRSAAPGLISCSAADLAARPQSGSKKMTSSIPSLLPGASVNSRLLECSSFQVSITPSSCKPGSPSSQPSRPPLGPLTSSACAGLGGPCSLAFGPLLPAACPRARQALVEA